MSFLLLLGEMNKDLIAFKVELFLDLSLMKIWISFFFNSVWVQTVPLRLSDSLLRYIILSVQYIARPSH